MRLGQSKKHLTKKAFELAARRVNISERRIELARQHLVDGRPQKEIAAEVAMTPQAVNKCVLLIWSAHIESEELPADLQRITVVLPHDKAAIALEWEKLEKIRRLRL